MTREEAIEQLQNCKGLIRQNGQDYLDERDFPLLDMAIEALSADITETEECKKCQETTERILNNQGEKLKAIKSLQDLLGVELKEENLTRPSAKLKKHCNSLLTDESNGSKEHKSKLDLISRADAMAEFREWVKRANENGETPTWNDAVSLIGSLPSANAVDGKWLKVGPFEYVYKCSECGHEPVYEGDILKMHFCSNCGAIMKGGAE